MVSKLSEIWSGLFIPDTDPGTGFWFFTHPGSTIQGSKRHRIPDLDPQHWYLPYWRCIICLENSVLPNVPARPAHRWPRVGGDEVNVYTLLPYYVQDCGSGSALFMGSWIRVKVRSCTAEGQYWPVEGRGLLQRFWEINLRFFSLATFKILPTRYSLSWMQDPTMKLG